MKRRDQQCSTNQLCQWFGISRQGYYGHKRLTERRKQAEAPVLEMVRQIRYQQPRIGVRKLHYMLGEMGIHVRIQHADRDQHRALHYMLGEMGIHVGRDRLFETLREHQMLVQRRKRYTRTTDSRHPFRYYPNLIKDIRIERPGQVYVSDITYIHTLEGFQYLALITDYSSRKIMGYDLSNSLSIDGSLRALKMALRQTKEPSELIHHSDRGIQYCCKDYIKILQKNKIRISMTEQDHVYENALAERVNGILKDEFCLGETLQSKEIARALVKESVKIYNQNRPHMALGYRTPESVYVAY